MRFRESISRIFHRTILTISSSSTTHRIPGIKTPRISWSRFVELCGSRLSPSPCLMANPGKDSERAGGFSKTFPGVPIDIRVWCGNPESWVSTPLGLGILRGVNCERGTFQSCSLSQDHRILCHHSRHSPCFAGSGSGTKADSSWKVLLSFEHEVHLFSIVELFPSLHDKFFVIPQFRSNLWRDFLEQVCSSS